MAIFRVKMIVTANNELRTELDDNDDNKKFNAKDAESYLKLVDLEEEAAENAEKRKKGNVIGKEQRVRADDYKGEPSYAHAGIHLEFSERDEIEWFSDQDINFLIEVGPDPELYITDEPLNPGDTLNAKRLHHKSNNPFQNSDRFPLISVNGKAVRSGPLRLGADNKPDPKVKKQRYYNYCITVLGTAITLDPHIEGHDGD